MGYMEAFLGAVATKMFLVHSWWKKFELELYDALSSS